MSARLAGPAIFPAILLGLAGAPPAEAFQGNAPVAATGDNAARKEAPAETDTPIDRFGAVRGEQLQVSTGTDDGQLTFRLALPTGPSMEHRFSFSAATPFQSNGDATPASLDALANGTRFTLSWGYFPLRVSDRTPETDHIADRAREACRKAEPGQDNCDLSTYAIYYHARPDWLRYQRLRAQGVTDWGLDATVGINDFEWIDPVTFGPQRDRRVDWSVAGHVTHFFPGRQLAATFSASYQRAYEAVEERLICPPNVVDPATQCMTARASAPNRNENFLISAGFRYRLIDANGDLGRFAIAPVVNYDVIDDVWGIELPIYFIPGDNNSLTGGIRLGWVSNREDEFTASVFVGTTFNFLGGGS